MPKGMTIDQIIKSCPPRVAYGAQSAVIETATPKITKDKRQKLICKTKTMLTLDDRRKPPPPMRKYMTTVECVEPGKFIKARDALVKVSCQCDDYWSTWEFALHRKGAADIIYSNGEPCDVRNPKFIPGCCKHIFAVLKGIRGHKIGMS